MRMLMNNLDPEVAELSEQLVVYGGRGQAARSWEAYDAIIDMKAKGMKATNYWQFDTYDFDAAYRAAKENSVIEPSAAYITSMSPDEIKILEKLKAPMLEDSNLKEKNADYKKAVDAMAGEVGEAAMLAMAVLLSG